MTGRRSSNSSLFQFIPLYFFAHVDCTGHFRRNVFPAGEARRFPRGTGDGGGGFYRRARPRGADGPVRGAAGDGNGDGAGNQGGVPVHGQAVTPRRVAAGGRRGGGLHRDPPRVRDAVEPSGPGAVRPVRCRAAAGAAAWRNRPVGLVPVQEMGDGSMLVEINQAGNVKAHFKNENLN